MTRTRWPWFWSALALMALVLAIGTSDLRADDTDIYIGRLAPPTSTPLVMFTLDTSTSLGATYAGCSKVGVGVTMCAAAQYFAANCPTCVLPASDQPLTIFDAERFAIRMILLKLSGMKVGLALSHNNQNNCAGPQPTNLLGVVTNKCSNGAYIARGFKDVDHVTNPLTIPATVTPGPNLQEFLSILDHLPEPKGSVAHQYQGKEVFFELFRYLTGQGIYNGHNGWTDYGTDSTFNLNQDNTAIDWDSGVEVPLTSLYLSPMTTDLTCSRIFTVNFVVGGSSQDNDSDAAITATAGNGGMPGINLTGTSNSFQTVIAYLHDVDLASATQPLGTVPALSGKQNVTSYFFDRPQPLNSNPPTFTSTSTSWAQAGGTQHPLPISDDPDTLVSSLDSVTNQILSVSTTFVAASVPVNVFNRTQTLNDVYLALFQPDIAAKPFWNGNVKKVHAQTFDVTCTAGDPNCTPTKQVRLVDVYGNDAVDVDGRLKSSALTFWTDGSRIAADPTNGVQAGRDGRVVNLGGAGQKIPGYISGAPGLSNSTLGARQLYFYPGSGNQLLPLNADATTATQLQAPLGAATSTEALSLLTYLRGYDTYDIDGDLNTTEVRPWLMADPLHSRPLPVNYGALAGYSQTNPAIYIAVSTNDGLLHFIKNTDNAGGESGVEQWAFMPIDLMNIEKVLAVDNPLQKRIYGFDGTPTAYVYDQNNNGTIDGSDKVWLYAGMRRGGRAYYALNVTDPTTPRFMWKAGPTLSLTPAVSLACTLSFNAGTALSAASACATQYNLMSCSGDFCELGYTFSQPRVGKVQTGVDGSGKPVIKTAVFFGGGYDLNKDYTQTTLNVYNSGLATSGTIGTDDTVGNAIYVVDAETGALIWKAVKGNATGPTADTRVFTHSQLVDSIPSALTVVDTDGDGVIDRIVVGDTGGNVWRADVGGAPASWKLTLLAKLGRHATGSPTKLDDRRFFHEPDFVQSRDDAGAFDGVVIGSGDREDPLDYGRGRTVSGTTTTDILTENAIYMVKDRNIGIGTASDANSANIILPSQLADVTADCMQNATASACGLNLASGWRLQLRQAPGEKALASPLTAANRIYTTTYLPPNRSDSQSCAPSEGRGLFYAIGLLQGTAAYNFNTADGGTATLANSASDRYQALSSAGIPTEPVYLNLPDASTGADVKCILGSDLSCRSLAGATRFRTFWNRVEP